MKSAGNRVAGDAADRHIAGAGPDRVAGAAPDRPVAGAAAEHQLVPEVSVYELTAAGAAGDRIARGAQDRNIAIADKDAVIAAGILHPVIAVPRGKDTAIGGDDPQALIARRGRNCRYRWHC